MPGIAKNVKATRPRGQTKVTTTPAGHDQVVGPTPAELESLKDLIKFDHIYYKTPKSTDLAEQDGKMVVVSLPEPVESDDIDQPDTMESEVEISSSPQIVLDEDVMDLMDYETVASLSKLLDLDSFLQGNLAEEPALTDMAATTTTSDEMTKETPCVISQDTQPTITLTCPSRKRKASLSSNDSSSTGNTPSLTVLGSDDVFGMDASSPLMGNHSDSGYGSDMYAMSPNSDASSLLGDDIWEDSFTELFPSLL